MRSKWRQERKQAPTRSLGKGFESGLSCVFGKYCLLSSSGCPVEICKLLQVNTFFAFKYENLSLDKTEIA